MTPLLVLVSFLTLRVDRGLVLALVAAPLSTWLVALVGYGYAALVADELDERGALALGVGFPNTGFLGYPLAHLAFGQAGLALAVVYARFAWLIPDLAVSTAVARLHGRRPRAAPRRRSLAPVLLNPPLLAMAAALSLRVAGVHLPLLSEARSIGAAVVGPAGFLLLGLSLPLEPVEHAPVELARAAGALAIHFGGGPLALLGIGRLLGADVPRVFYLLAGMPCAFHVLVLARVYDLRPALMRLLVVGSTLTGVTAVLIAVGVTR